MRKRTKRQPRPARCPTLVAMHLAPEVETAELMAVQCLANGTACTDQFNILSDCRDLLSLAAHEKRDSSAMAVCEIAYMALMNIKDRYVEKGRLGASGDELQALRVMVEFSQDWWKRQSGELFRLANVALDKARGFQREVAR